MIDTVAGGEVLPLFRLLPPLIFHFLLVLSDKPVTVHGVDRDRRIRIDAPLLSILFSPCVLDLKADSFDPFIYDTLSPDISLALLERPLFNR